MKILHNFVAHLPASAVAIGNFDGVHCGHQHLLSQLKTFAQTQQLASVVLSFNPHPREYFAKIKHQAIPSRISSLRTKVGLLAQQEIDYLVIQSFNRAFSCLSARDFIVEILKKRLSAQAIWVGHDFRFGANREGDIKLLQQLAKGYDFEVRCIDDYCIENKRISSSMIRAALQAGNLEQAKQYLGYSYQLSGRVIRGRQLGRTLGIPTINIRFPGYQVALSGIFVVLVEGLGDIVYQGVASIGRRPTIENDGEILLEVYLFNFNQDCYGKRVKVKFLQKLRDEEKYENLALMQAAIQQDILNTQLYFQNNYE